MFFKPKQKMIDIEAVGLTYKSVVAKTPIISVMPQLKDERVDFFVAKDDEVIVLTEKELESIGITPTDTDTYFVVVSINNTKSFNVFKLNTDLFNLIAI